MVGGFADVGSDDLASAVDNARAKGSLQCKKPKWCGPLGLASMAERAAVEPVFHFASENLKKSEINPIKTMVYVFLLFHWVSDDISQSCVFFVYFSV